ncbi:MAG: formimidoylglutamate deiminase [Oceanicaulis sp.]|uniref:formimidoylglutamate deiminase n=1 Tax=Glycocaulis sp. TaxID=1969725 RepID=UPI0025C6B0FA|nr:formimidoylglutamate deiminase [Glycocaulis sp.]MCC5981211.1 formimidoylglutamate deiminase [Oceanicaulis sp.]MCH8521725.1 formimidoylglutamate deiminase [Glycocaulis sp.]
MTIIHARRALLPEGWAEAVTVTLDGGRIAAVGTGAPAPAHAVRVGVLLPAPANIHSHAFQRAMAGLTERRGPDPSDSFWTWRRLMYRFLEALTPEDVTAIAAFVQMEMLEAGYGASVEFHYLHHAPGGAPYDNIAEMSASIADAAAQSGIALTLLPVLYQQGGCDGRPLQGGQTRFGNSDEQFARLVEGAEAALAPLPDDCRLGIAAHSLRAVTPQALDFAGALRPGAPFHMHLAEQIAEVEEVEAHLGARPVRWLLDHAEIDARWCLVHCTQMERDETLALARSGAVAGLCPITESSLGDGIFDGVAYLGAGGRFAIGSDSNIRISLSEELRTLEYSQRLRDGSRAALARPDKSTGRVLFEGACLGGAQAAGRQAGAIAPGLIADLAALDDQAISLTGREGDALLDSWIFAGDDRLVSDVWSGGRHLVKDGRHIAREAIEAAWRAAAGRLTSS